MTTFFNPYVYDIKILNEHDFLNYDIPIFRNPSLHSGPIFFMQGGGEEVGGGGQYPRALVIYSFFRSL